MAIFNFVPTPSFGGDENRVDETRRLEIEQSPEPAELRLCAWSAGRASKGPYAVNEPIADIDIDARHRRR